jgi:hypothetical protein
VVLRAEVRRHQPGVRSVPAVAIGKVDRESVERPRRAARHQREHRRGVDSAREEDAYWHVGHFAQRHRLLQQRSHFRHYILLGDARPRREAQAPVAEHTRLATGLDGESVRGGQFAHPLPGGERRRYVLERQVLFDRPEVDGG